MTVLSESKAVNGARVPRPKLKLRLSVSSGNLPHGRSWSDRFQLASDAGFEGVEVAAVMTRDAVVKQDEAEEIRQAALATGIKVHSVDTQSNWNHPLSSGDPAEVSKGVRATLAALECARLWGADTMLLIPAVVDAQTFYGDAYTRSQRIIREQILPVAADHGIVLAVENCWNGFLLSPLEYIRYIDEFESQWVKPYLDMGNQVFGRPEQWIRAAGSRIAKIHVKDFWLDKAGREFDFGPVGTGAVKWDAVCDALNDVGFSGWATCTGLKRRFFKRAFDYAGRNRRRRTFEMLPGVRWALWTAQRQFTLRMLREATDGFERHLQ